MHSRILLISCITMLAFISIAWADSWNVEMVGREPLGWPNDILVLGDYAYLCAGGALIVLDVTQPQYPVQIGRINIPGIAQEVRAVADLAYVADSETGLHVIDVSNPSTPLKVGSYDLSSGAVGVYVYDGYAYVIDGDHDIHIVNVTDRADPDEVGCYTYGYTYGIYVIGYYAYVVESYGFRVLDISDPSTPQEVGFCSMPKYSIGIQVSEGYAYVAVDWKGGLWVIDVSDPSDPYKIGSWEESSMNEVQIIGERAYAACGFGGLNILDVSDPSNPCKLGALDGSYDPDVEDISVSGNYAYTSAGWGRGGIWVMDVSVPSNIQKVGFYRTPSAATEVYVLDDYAYINDMKAGLRIMNISDPSSPYETGFYNTGAGGYAMHVVGNYAYVTNRYSNLVILDISNPSNPTWAGSYEFSPGQGWVEDIHVVGDRAYIAAGIGGLRILNISDPLHPYELGFCNAPLESIGVYVAGDYAYLADTANGLWIIDVSDPYNPYETALYSSLGEVRDSYIHNDYAYIPDYYSLRVVDISDSENPQEVGFCDTPGDATWLWVSGGYAYVADQDSGLRVINVSDPANPYESGFYDTPGSAWGIHVAGGHAYVADREGGLCILEYTGPDGVPPAAITDLSATSGPNPNEIVLEWTAPGDDWDIGTASEYIIRYNTVPITESNWDESYDADGEPIPGSAGMVENMTVTMPHPSAIYYFAIKLQDEVPNTSGVSNSPRVKSNVIYLYTGCNLISLYMEPFNPNIQSVLSAIQGDYKSVWGYNWNPGWSGHFSENLEMSSLEIMESGAGYWINMRQASPLPIQGTTPAKSISLYEGWNLVGYCHQTSEPIETCMSSVENDYNSVWEYHSIEGWRWYRPDMPGESTLRYMRPGMGYWIDAKMNCMWDIDPPLNE